jgi:superoxide dismutase, Cu-Zn family
MNIVSRLSLIGAAALLGACQNIPPTLTAVAQIQPTSAAQAAGLNPTGTITFTQIGSGMVMVEAKVSGLKPNSEHGFHVHAVPDCSGDGTKTGAHFNPDNHPHTHPGQPHRHAGAMFNLKTDANGVGTLRQDVDTISLKPGKYSIIGQPIITHQGPDDYKSQPLGNAGPRIGCGLISAG